MAKNRKNDSALRFAPAAKAVLLCAFFVSLGVGYCGYKSQISALGHQIKERETRLLELERQNKMRRDQLSALCSPVQIDANVRRFKLGLGPPALSQIIRMVETSTAAQPTMEDVSSEQRLVLAGSSAIGN